MEDIVTNQDMIGQEDLCQIRREIPSMVVIRVRCKEDQCQISRQVPRTASKAGLCKEVEGPMGLHKIIRRPNKTMAHHLVVGFLTSKEVEVQLLRIKVTTIKGTTIKGGMETLILENSGNSSREIRGTMHPLVGSRAVSGTTIETMDKERVDMAKVVLGKEWVDIKARVVLGKERVDIKARVV